MIGSTTDAAAATAAAATGATGATNTATNKPLDREAFLKLLVAQISHQDPLKPMEGTEFVSQLSQFAVVEQAIAQSSSLDSLSAQVRGVANNASIDLVGKQVTVRGNSLSYDGVTAATTAVTLGGDAAKMSVEVTDSSGKVLRTIEIGAHAKGPVQVVWDGKDANGMSAKAGTYSLVIHAQDAEGTAVNTTQDVTGTVTRVAFDKGFPEVTLDNGTTAAISDLVGVSSTPAPASK